LLEQLVRLPVESGLHIAQHCAYLDIHVQLSPKSTTAVAIQPTGPGRLEFYCSVLGHRAAGMVGTITSNRLLWADRPKTTDL
jgi:hypothetical protein